MLVWLPDRVVPGYASADDVRLSDGVHECADADLADYVRVHWNAAVRSEEDEEVIGHPRDPFHRIDIRESSRHVVVSLEGQAATTLLFKKHACRCTTSRARTCG